MTSHGGDGSDHRRRAIKCNHTPPPIRSSFSSLFPSSSPIIIIFLSSPSRDSLEFAGRTTTGRVSCASSSYSGSDSDSAAAVIFVDIFLLGVVIIVPPSPRMHLPLRPLPPPPPPPNVIVIIFDIAIALAPPRSTPTSSTKNNSCIACHFKGCWRAGQHCGGGGGGCGGGGGGGCGGIQRSVPGTIVDICGVTCCCWRRRWWHR